MLRSLSPLPCNVGSSYILYLIHIFIMVCTFQSGICHLTLTSFSWSTDFIKFTSSFHHGVTFSTTYNLGSPCLVHTFIMEGTCQTYMCHLSLTSFSQSTGVVKHDQVCFSTTCTIPPRFTTLGPHIMVCTCQSGICHLTLASFSWSVDFVKFASSFHDYMIRPFSPLPYKLGSQSLIHTFIIVCACQAGMCHLTLTSYR